MTTHILVRSACLGLAVSLAAINGLAAVRQGTVSLRSVVIDAESAEATRKSGALTDVHLVKFPGPVSAAQKKALEKEADRVFSYLPFDAFLVRSAPENMESLVRTVGASWSAPYLPEYKISPEVAAAKTDDERVRPVMVHLFPDVDVDVAVRRIEQIVGRSVEGITAKTRFARARVLLSGREVAALHESLAQLSEVFWLERESRKVFFNDSTVWVGQSGLDGGGATPVFDNGILGAGQVVGVLDTGIDVDSCFFRDDGEQPAMNICDGGVEINDNHRKVLAVDFLWNDECSGGISDTEWDTHGHGTHVAGTVAGDNLASPGQHDGYDGMAPQARLVIQDCGYEYNACADCPGIGCPVIDLVPVFEQPYNQGVRVHTNSWGDEEEDPAWGEYTSASQDADTVMWNHKDYLLLFAAGNNGGTSNTVDSPSTAKSPLSVGATGHGSGADSIASFSSRGPTDDGRIKPSITIVGSNVVSAATDYNIGTNNCDVQSMSGTSMASPGAAGLAALVRQYLVDGWYPTGSASPPDSILPSAALLRAVLVNSGESMQGEADIPSDAQGWGRIQLDNVLYFPGDRRKLWIEDDEVGFADGATGATRTYQFSVSSALEPLEVTLAWTDYPSNPAVSPNINNDLDLRVEGPDGVFLGNVFAGGQSTTGGNADRVNTLENVVVNTPSPGLWVVTVESFAVPDGPQPFALVATGDITPCVGGGSVVAVSGSELITVSGGDGDDFLDNCESATVWFSVANTGLDPATSVRVVSVSSPSHAETVFAAPVWTSASIPACGVVDDAFVEISEARGLSHGETLLVAVEVTNDETAPATRTAILSVPSTETDVIEVESLVFDFESDAEGWSVVSGTFDRADALDAPGGFWYLQSSSNFSDQCDVVRSPPIVLSGNSTMSVTTHYEIEEGPTWYDRANIRVIDEGASTVVNPDGGRSYDVPDGSSNGTCGTANEAGWAGIGAAWEVSSFSASALGSGALAGRPVVFEVRYGTDSGVHYDGFAFDLFEITDVLQAVPDAQGDSCGSPEVFADGFESGETLEWSVSVP